MSKNFWYGKCYGYHADLHLCENDHHSGEEADPELLYEQLKVLDPDWVQVDSKGHPGYCSFRSKLDVSSVAPNMQNDPVMAWRVATERLGLPLICHYSDFIDCKACKLHPEWEAVTPYGLFADNFNRICPRSDYFDKLLLPQIDELLTDYRVDGIWFDGDVWGFMGCWCDKCRAEFTRRTGITEIPETDDAPYWQEWCRFQYDSFCEREEKTVRAIKEKHPNAQICFNWMGSHFFPDMKEVECDWLSGDSDPDYSIDFIKKEAPFFANSGYGWDLMSWPYNVNLSKSSLGFYIKPHESLCQEAAYILSYGGKWISCNAATFARTSRQVDWHLPRINAVGRFIRERKEAAYGTSSVYDVSVFRSKNVNWSGKLTDYPRQTDAENSTWASELFVFDLHYSLNTLNEDSLEKGKESRVIILPDEEDIGEKTVKALKDYVANGGNLIVTGYKNGEKFGYDYFGVLDPEIETVCPNAGENCFIFFIKDELPEYFLSDGKDGVFPMESTKWVMLEKFMPDAVAGEPIYSSTFPQRSKTPYHAWSSMPHGKGSATFVPFEIFSFARAKRLSPTLRNFFGRVIESVYHDRLVDVKAPSYVNVVLRKKDGRMIVHLLNGSTGAAGSSADRLIVEEIPPIFNIETTVVTDYCPKKIKAVPSGEQLPFEVTKTENGYKTKFVLQRLDIHEALVLED